MRKPENVLWGEVGGTIPDQPLEDVDEATAKFVHDVIVSKDTGEHVTPRTVQYILGVDREVQKLLHEPDLQELLQMLGIVFMERGLTDPLRSVQEVSAFLATLDRAGYKVVLA